MKLYAKGSRVNQGDYGAGTVTSSEERYTIIEFDTHGRKMFLTDMVTLTKSDVPAPNKPVKEKRKKAVPKDGEAAAPAKPKKAKAAKKDA
jgi:hypothetical protein